MQQPLGVVLYSINYTTPFFAGSSDFLQASQIILQASQIWKSAWQSALQLRQLLMPPGATLTTIAGKKVYNLLSECFIAQDHMKSLFGICGSR